MNDRKKPGRPIERDGKRIRFTVRMTERDAKRLDDLAKEIGRSRSETLLYGLDLIEEELENE